MQGVVCVASCMSGAGCNRDSIVSFTKCLRGRDLIRRRLKGTASQRLSTCLSGRGSSIHIRNHRCFFGKHNDAFSYRSIAGTVSTGIGNLGGGRTHCCAFSLSPSNRRVTRLHHAVTSAQRTLSSTNRIIPTSLRSALVHACLGRCTIGYVSTCTHGFKRPRIGSGGSLL